MKTMKKELTKKQKSVIAQVASKAYKSMFVAGAAFDDMATFRHEAQLDAVGKASLMDCDQGDYVTLYNYFASIAGLQIIKDNTRSYKDKAAWILADTLRRHELNNDYLAAIARDKFPRLMAGYTEGNIMEAIHTKLDDNQIMQLVYTANNRGRTKNRKVSDNNDLDHSDFYEPHQSDSTLPPGRMQDYFSAKKT